MTGAIRTLLTILVCYVIAACGGPIRSRNGQGQLPTATGQRNDSNLAVACGSKGMTPDFATGNCFSQSGKQINPFDLYPPFQAPIKRPSDQELIQRCAGQGRTPNFATGRCT